MYYLEYASAYTIFLRNVERVSKIFGRDNGMLLVKFSFLSYKCNKSTNTRIEATWICNIKKLIREECDKLYAAQLYSCHVIGWHAVNISGITRKSVFRRGLYWMYFHYLLFVISKNDFNRWDESKCAFTRVIMQYITIAKPGEPMWSFRGCELLPWQLPFPRMR